MNKTALITGASRGIGRRMAEQFAAEGYHVAVNYFKSAAPALELAAALGRAAIAVQADVSRRDQVYRMIQRVTERFGKIDVLINNAGISEFKLFNDITAQDWQRMFDINVNGAFNCTQAVIDGMISRKYGRIINISSIWGITGASCEVHYSASKAALIGLTKALAKEVGPSGITVNCIAPGVIGTDMNACLTEETLRQLKEETPLGRIGTADDIAALSVFLASEKGAFITGQVISPNGGFLI